jgi:hypothetical protein
MESLQSLGEISPSANRHSTFGLDRQFEVVAAVRIGDAEGAVDESTPVEDRFNAQVSPIEPEFRASCTNVFLDFNLTLQGIHIRRQAHCKVRSGVSWRSR